MASLLTNRNAKFVVAALAICGLLTFFVIPSGGFVKKPQTASFKEEFPQTPEPNGIVSPPYKHAENGAPLSTKVVTQPTVAAKPASSSPAKIQADKVHSTENQKSGSFCKEKKEYVVMIDAGSTGSRVHVYEFDLCYSPPKLLNESFKMLKPGLSSFDTDTVGAAKSLDPLLEVALSAVPESQRACTPVAVKATAGLRLLGEEKSANILKEVRRHLEEDFPFAVVEGDGISIMDGSDEGVYAWITTNYLLGNIGSAEKLPTAAVFDLGGGSTQIVFEPSEGESMIDGEHKYKTAFGGREFTLYQYSHLGYGLMRGRGKVNSLVLQTSFEALKDQLKPVTDVKTAKASASVKHPCIPPGMKAENVIVELEDKKSYCVDFVPFAESEDDPKASSAATQCRFLADSILNKDLECKEKPCSFNGIYQPSLIRQFSKENDMFIFSYFYDRLNPLGMPNSFTLDEMKELTKLVCSGSKFWNQYLTQPSSVKELTEEPQWCLDLSFMISLLHTGYDIPLSRELKTAKTIQDNELGWCLGASLPLLDKDAAGWKCKVVKEL